MTPLPSLIDVAIVGGGPAGLSAALFLGRCRRSVVVIDAGHGRNFAARRVHAFLTRDPIPPARFRRLAHAELVRYGVRTLPSLVLGVTCRPDQRFDVQIQGGSTLVARRVLLATGVRDLLPDIPGIADCYGVTVHHCPYCDAWEHRDTRLVAYGKGRAALGLALALRQWSDQVTACTDGVRLREADVRTAAANSIQVRTEKVERLECAGSRVRRIHFRSGEPVPADALFFNTGQVQRSELPRGLGCTFKADGGVIVNRRQGVGIPGVYLAGDAHREVQFVVVAAAEGATAAVAINRSLQDEDVAQRAREAEESATDASRRPHPRPAQRTRRPRTSRNP